MTKAEALNLLRKKIKEMTEEEKKKLAKAVIIAGQF